jgi:hypothetical protein
VREKSTTKAADVYDFNAKLTQSAPLTLLFELAATSGIFTAALIFHSSLFRQS